MTTILFNRVAAALCAVLTISACGLHAKYAPGELCYASCKNKLAFGNIEQLTFVLFGEEHCFYCSNGGCLGLGSSFDNCEGMNRNVSYDDYAAGELRCPNAPGSGLQEADPATLDCHISSTMAVLFQCSQ